MAPRGFRQRDMTSGISPCSTNHLLLIASLACGVIAILYQPLPLPARSHALHSGNPFHEVFPLRRFLFPLHGLLRTLSALSRHFTSPPSADRQSPRPKVIWPSRSLFLLFLPMRFRSPRLLTDSALRRLGRLLWLLLTSPRPSPALAGGVVLSHRRRDLQE